MAKAKFLADECTFVQTVLLMRKLGFDVGAADKAAIQLVEVQPYQLLVSDT
jgi:hypothetical protein